MSDPTRAIATNVVCELFATTDAAVWAKRFCEAFAGYTKGYQNADEPLDEGAVEGWFANAIETGRAHEAERIAAGIRERRAAPIGFDVLLRPGGDAEVGRILSEHIAAYRRATGAPSHG